MSGTGIHTNSPKSLLSITNPCFTESSDGFPFASVHFAVPVFPTSEPSCSYGLKPAGIVGLFESAFPPSTVLFSVKYPSLSGLPGFIIVADLLSFVIFPTASFAQA